MPLTRRIDSRAALAMARGLIFDMDGTIVDTRPFHMTSWRRLVQDHGFGEREYLICERGFGKTNHAIFGEWFAGRGDRPDYLALSDEKEALFRRLIAGRVRPRPGFHELLDAARRRGIRIALATSGPKENALFLLREMNVLRQFDAVIWGGAAAAPGKPHPEPFLRAAARMGVLPQHCVVFEDSSHGLWAGQRAGMTLAAIAERSADLTWIRKWTPFCFTDFRPMARLLERAG